MYEWGNSAMKNFLSKVWARTCSIVNFKVTHWHLEMGGGDEGDPKIVGARLEESIWYWHLLEFLSEQVLFTICDWCHKIPLPKFVCNWKRDWGGEWNDHEVCTLESWYGNELGDFWHIWIESPILQWVWKHKFGEYSTAFNFTLSEARDRFKGNLAHHLDWIEERVKEDAEEAAEEAKKVVEK
jgi:hypothetical protein